MYALLLVACTATRHAVIASSPPVAPATDNADFYALIDQPGPIRVETVASADWAVPLSGLLDLKDPKATGLEDRDEPIQVYFHAIEHPKYGLFIIDTGVETALRDHPKDAAVRGFAAGVMHVER